MQRLTVALREGRRWEQARRLARGLNPVMVSPAAPREKVAALDAWGPSLMPRTARLQGVAMGLGVLGARATSGAAELLTRMVAPAEAPLRARLVARAVVGGAGAALAAVPERHCRHLWVASLRSTGLLLRDGAAGGAVHDVGHWLQRRYPSQRGSRPLAIGAVHTAGLRYRAGRRLPARGAAVDRRRLPETTSMATTLATSYVVTPELIEAVMGEPALAHPIRTYVGFNSEPLYQTGRAELALAELARTGAFDRSVLLLISPTGTGWVDHTLIEAAEFLTRGDIATCCIQYARYPSFLSVQKVALGRGQFRLLLWGVTQRLAGLPP